MNKAYKHDFKVGDKVAYQNKNANMQIGIVKFVDENGDCAVRFDPKDNPNMLSKNSILSAESAYMMSSYYEHYQPIPKVSVLIIADPITRVTTVSYAENDILKVSAKARCNPEDKWDAMLGAQIAFRRLIEKLDCQVMINAQDILDSYMQLLGIKED